MENLLNNPSSKIPPVRPWRAGGVLVVNKRVVAMHPSARFQIHFRPSPKHRKRHPLPPEKTAPIKPASFLKFLIFSLILHGLLFGGLAFWWVGFQGPELTLAQGAISLEIINVSPGQEGIAVSPGEGAALSKKEKPEPKKIIEDPVVTERETKPVESRTVTQNESEASAADALEEMEPVSDSDPQPDAVSIAKKVAAAKPASSSAPSPLSDKGKGEKAAQSGSAAPSVFQPGTPGGMAASTVSNPTPPYPEMARRQGVEGAVVLRLVIDTVGRVRHAVVLKSSGRGDFDHAAVETIERRWRYRPARSWGKPVESSEVVRVCFVLGEA